MRFLFETFMDVVRMLHFDFPHRSRMQLPRLEALGDIGLLLPRLRCPLAEGRGVGHSADASSPRPNALLFAPSGEALPACPGWGGGLTIVL